MNLAFILAALTLSGRIHEWHIVVLAALLGVINAFDMPARQAFIVQMVERDDLMNARIIAHVCVTMMTRRRSTRRPRGRRTAR